MAQRLVPRPIAAQAVRITVMIGKCDIAIRTHQINHSSPDAAFLQMPFPSEDCQRNPELGTGGGQPCGRFAVHMDLPRAM